MTVSTTPKGSSPHVRGARRQRGPCGPVAGIIPACAGSTPVPRRRASPDWDHPRMCGEHADRSRAKETPMGIIPACAGSTPGVRGSPPSTWDHPRMCGEHASGTTICAASLGSSPHVRGAPFENSIIPRKRKDNWLFSIQFRFENFLAFRYLLALLHPFLGVPTKDPSFASLGRLINCNPSQSTGDQSAPYTLKAICCSFLAE